MREMDLEMVSRGPEQGQGQRTWSLRHGDTLVIVVEDREVRVRVKEIDYGRVVLEVVGYEVVSVDVI